MSGYGFGSPVPTFISTGATAGSIAAGAGVFGAAAIAVPVVGAVALAATLIYSWIARRGAQKVAATSVVNEAEPYLRQNRDAFLALQTPTATDQAQAVSNFQAVWAQVVKECASPGLGNAGHACIEDRMPIGQEISTPVGTLTGNGKWNWFGYYLDPIEQAQTYAASPSSLFTSLGLPSLGDGGSPVFLALGAGLIAWAVWG